MAAVFPRISGEMQSWIEAQPMFFVASAPLSSDGHVNVSPKGYDALRVMDDHTVAYLDLTGSGAETAAHLRENGRITVMFCAFQGPPRILRLFGTGTAHQLGSGEFDRLAPRFPDLVGARAVVEVDVHRVQTSCGFGVPEMAVVEQRSRLLDWSTTKGAEGLSAYRSDKNAVSIDGLPSLGADTVDHGESGQSASG